MEVLRSKFALKVKRNLRQIGRRLLNTDSVVLQTLTAIATLGLGTWDAFNGSLTLGNHSVYYTMLACYSEKVWDSAFIISGIVSLMSMVSLCWGIRVVAQTWLAFLWLYTALLIAESRGHALVIWLVSLWALITIAGMVFVIAERRHTFIYRPRERLHV